MPKKIRQHTVPVIINSPDDDSVQVLQPVPLSEHGIEERMLQKLLSMYPHMIPIDEIEPALGPLICLGMEVLTKSGPVDLLYVSPTGYLSLVETKLWRNPEARGWRNPREAAACASQHMWRDMVPKLVDWNPHCGRFCCSGENES